MGESEGLPDASCRRLAVMGGVSLCVDDVSCLLEDDEWLNDKVIHFYLEYLRYNKFTEHIEDIEIVSPAVVQCLKVSRSREVVENMVAPLQLGRKKVVVLPLNNAKQDESGGTHWSIIVLTPRGGQFYHFDSLDMNRECAKVVAGKMQQQLRFPRPRFLHFKGVPQDNSFDCGLYVLLNAETSIRHFVEGRDANTFVPARKDDVRDMRKVILAVIRDVSEEQQEVESD